VKDFIKKNFSVRFEYDLSNSFVLNYVYSNTEDVHYNLNINQNIISMSLIKDKNIIYCRLIDLIQTNNKIKNIKIST